MWFQKPKLFEQKPETLSLEALMTLQSSLMVKLMQTNDELMKRHQRMVELTKGLPDEATFISTFTMAAKELRGFNVILNQVLAQNLGKS